MHLKIKQFLFSVASLAMASLTLTGCGSGGGGGEDEGEPTARPKTLDNVSLTMPFGEVGFSFIRGMSSPKAVNDGDTETGTFIYTFARSSADYESVEGYTIKAVWPYRIGPATYTYRAINDTTGEITLTSSNFMFNDFPAGGSSIIHEFFSNYNAVGDPMPTSTIRMLVSFESTGSTITTTNMRMEDPDTPNIFGGGGPLDLISSSVLGTPIFRVQGSSLPYNYNPVEGPGDRHSKLSIEKLGGTNVEFTDDADVTQSFSMVFTTTGSLPEIDDVGEASYRSNDGSVVISAAGYSYDRILGSDDALLVVSGGTPNDGTITMTATSVGTTTQDYAGTYVTASGRTGTFLVRGFR